MNDERPFGSGLGLSSIFFIRSSTQDFRFQTFSSLHRSAFIIPRSVSPEADSAYTAPALGTGLPGHTGTSDRTRGTVVTEVDFIRLRDGIAADMGERHLPELYRTLVLATRTRRFTLSHDPIKHITAEGVSVLHTLLGIELKIGKHRLSCPDLATARYLQVFARLGLTEVAVPYDISQLPRIADEFESAWQFYLLLLENRTAALPARSRRSVRNRLIDNTRHAIESLGSGEKVPTFNQNTRQRTAIR